jgi:hypothetical protein
MPRRIAPFCPLCLSACRRPPITGRPRRAAVEMLKRGWHEWGQGTDQANLAVVYHGSSDIDNAREPSAWP